MHARQIYTQVQAVGLSTNMAVHDHGYYGALHTLSMRALLDPYSRTLMRTENGARKCKKVKTVPQV